MLDAEQPRGHYAVGLFLSNAADDRSCYSTLHQPLIDTTTMPLKYCAEQLF
jgi:hypothetical protein